MTFVLDPATEARLQRELATGRYTGPSELVAHALDLIEAEGTGLTQRRTEMLAEIEESVAQLDRGEFVTKEQLRARIEARRAASHDRQAA